MKCALILLIAVHLYIITFFYCYCFANFGHVKSMCWQRSKEGAALSWTKLRKTVYCCVWSSKMDTGLEADHRDCCQPQSVGILWPCNETWQFAETLPNCLICLLKWPIHSTMDFSMIAITFVECLYTFTIVQQKYMLKYKEVTYLMLIGYSNLLSYYQIWVSHFKALILTIGQGSTKSLTIKSWVTSPFVVSSYWLK